MMSATTIRNPLALLLLAVACLCVGSAWGDDGAQSKERVALKRSQQQAQQLRQEKAALEEKLAATDKEKADLQAGNDKTAKQLSSALGSAKTQTERANQLQAALDAMTQGKAAADAQNKSLETQLAALQRKQQDTARQLDETANAKKQLEDRLYATAHQLTDTETKNYTLYQWGRDLIDQCRDKSATDTVLRLEPFTGIKRVEIENQLETYRDRFDKERVSGTVVPTVQ